MKSSRTSIAKSLVLSLAILAFCTISQSVARADIVVTGNTNGSSFGNNLQPTLTFTPANFSGQTSGGNSSLFTIGTFTLTGRPADASGSFNLSVAINSPFVPFGNPRSISAEAFLDSGNLYISFTNPTQFYIFGGFIGSPDIESTSSTGVFSMTVYDLVFSNLPAAPSLNSLDPQSTYPISMDLQASVSETPEPATMILLGTGLAGVAARVRRRRKA